MKPMGLIGLILGVLVIAGLVVLLLRTRRTANTPVEEPGRPRTVAELVQSRAAAAQQAQPEARAAAVAADSGVDEPDPAPPVSDVEPAAQALAVAASDPVPVADDDVDATATPQPAAPVEPVAAQAPRDAASISPPWGRVPDGSLTLPTTAPPVRTSPPPVPPAVMARVVPRASAPVAPVALSVVPERAEVDEPAATEEPAAPVAADSPAAGSPARAEVAAALRSPAAAEPAAEPRVPAGSVDAPAAVDPAPSTTAGPADDWTGFTDWADIDTDEDSGQAAPVTTPDPTPAFGLAVVPRVVPAPEPASPDAQAARVQSDADASGRAGESRLADSASAEPTAAVPPPAAPAPPRVRLTPEQRTAVRAAAREAEQDAVDLSLLRILGFADPNPRPGAAAVISLATVTPFEPEIDEAGEDVQPVRFRVVRRGAVPVPDAAVALLDGRGREAGNGVTDVDGRGVVLAPRPGAYVLVSSAPDHQPGAVALTVDGEPLDVEVLLVGSGSVAGVVRGRDAAPVEGATATLLQDGEVVETVHTGSTGRYRIGDLAAGEYTLAVASPLHDPVAAVVRVPEQTDVEHDVVVLRATPLGDAPGDHLREAVRPL